jgi:lipopolysaccharide biosynthesis protein
VQRLRRAQSRLERRLTAAVQEIGMLRQFEMRAQALESELARRAAEIAELRREREERSRKAGNPLGGASIVSTPS